MQDQPNKPLENTVKVEEHPMAGKVVGHMNEKDCKRGYKIFSGIKQYEQAFMFLSYQDLAQSENLLKAFKAIEKLCGGEEALDQYITTKEIKLPDSVNKDMWDNVNSAFRFNALQYLTTNRDRDKSWRKTMDLQAQRRDYIDRMYKKYKLDKDARYEFNFDDGAITWKGMKPIPQGNKQVKVAEKTLNLNEAKEASPEKN